MPWNRAVDPDLREELGGVSHNGLPYTSMISFSFAFNAVSTLAM